MAETEHIRCCTVEDTQNAARTLALRVAPPACILLQGDLGAGKTTFARAFIHALSATPIEVASPTFTLVQIYPVNSRGAPAMLSHYDLYRLKHPEELKETGLEEALAEHITLIEWPQLAEDILPQDSIRVTLTFGVNEGERYITLEQQ